MQLTVNLDSTKSLKLYTKRYLTKCLIGYLLRFMQQQFVICQKAIAAHTTWFHSAVERSSYDEIAAIRVMLIELRMFQGSRIFV